MKIREQGDPRLEQMFGLDAPGAGVRPIVRLPRQGVPGWAIALIAGFSAVLLFFLLDSRRAVQPQPVVREGAPSQLLFSPEPPPLYIPPAPPPPQPLATPPAPLAPAPEPSNHSELKAAASLPAPQVSYPIIPGPVPPPPAPPIRSSSGSVLVIDTTAAAANAAGKAGSPSGSSLPGVSSMWGGRVQASALANRSDTVAQGALIPAVLETAFNSTSPGLARAIVSRDVRGFDGTKILIPRGSRIIGEYGSDVAAGQKRALITWTRLIRPDGMMIALDSPATDTLGRGGVEAHVNSHFFQRFLNAILRTSVEIGGAIATRAVTGPLFVAIPGATTGASDTVAQSSQITPTLSIPAGKSISIFVARDLEFPPEKQQ